MTADHSGSTARTCPCRPWNVLIRGTFIVLSVLCSSMVVTATGPDYYESVFAIDEEDGMLQTPELIRKYGYPMQQHEVTTDDGYLLTVTRIPSAKGGSPPVLLVHGLFASSADFLLIGPNNSLAYLLADQGHDVWLLDIRGNRYSNRHKYLSEESRAYWDFSWHEMGYYDLPATIDHILQVTSTKRLHYIGYSQGTTLFFVMASSRPEYNTKITRMYALAPVAYVQEVRSPIFGWLAENANDVARILNTIGVYHILPHNDAQYVVQRKICPPQIPHNFCEQLVQQIGGPNPNGTDRLALHIIGGHNPSGASTKQLLHYAQINRAGRFQQFAYEKREQNILRYGQAVPPVYNLSAITTPVVMFYGLNDWMVHPDNVPRLVRELPNVISVTQVEDRLFAHLDFLLGKYVRPLVYDKILDDITREHRKNINKINR